MDRQYLAKHCYKTCLEVLEEELVTSSHGSKEEQLDVLLACYRLLQTVQNKLQVDARLPARLLCLAYSTYKDIKVGRSCIIHSSHEYSSHNWNIHVTSS